MLAMEGAKKSSAISIYVTVTVVGGRTQATQKPPKAMDKRELLYCTVAYSIECEEGKWIIG
jgi:hypothetical protein